MNLKKKLPLALLFLGYFSMRIFFSLQTPYFEDDYSYFAMRQIDHISETGKPLINDTLSYGGRTFIFMPLYFYLLSFFTFLLPKIVSIKIISNLLASTIVFAIYIVCSKLGMSRNISLLCSALAAFMPTYLSETINKISNYSVIVPGTFFIIYLFLSMEKDNLSIKLLIPLTIFLVLVSSSVFLVLGGFLIFLALCYLENIEVERIKKEFLIFFLFFFLWANFIIFKSAFQIHGFSIIWGNLPKEIVAKYFSEIDFLSAAVSIGILPFIFGLYTIYNYILKAKNKNLLVIIGFFMFIFIMFSSKLIKADMALIFMGAALSVLFGKFLSDFFSYLKNTKFSGSSKRVYLIILALLLITQILPSLVIIKNSVKNVPPSDYFEGFAWISGNTPVNTTIASINEEGHIINYFAKTKTKRDSEFILIEDPDMFLEDTRTIYTQAFRVDALRTLEKYGAEYIVLSQKAKEKYMIKSINYINEECFDLEYAGYIEIYKWDKQACGLKTI